MFDFIFKPNSNEYLKRAAVMLREANLARVEHQAAAEHHGALAQMYAERASRLERELYDSKPMPWHDSEPEPPVLSEKVRPVAFGAERRLERG